jgi:hypothetical protein
MSTLPTILSALATVDKVDLKRGDEQLSSDTIKMIDEAYPLVFGRDGLLTSNCANRYKDALIVLKRLDPALMTLSGVEVLERTEEAQSGRIMDTIFVNGVTPLYLWETKFKVGEERLGYYLSCTEHKGTMKEFLTAWTLQISDTRIKELIELGARWFRSKYGRNIDGSPIEEAPVEVKPKTKTKKQ